VAFAQVVGAVDGPASGLAALPVVVVVDADRHPEPGRLLDRHPARGEIVIAEVVGDRVSQPRLDLE
jgi:hypothetical protein